MSDILPDGTKLTRVSHVRCPYVQRAVIALTEKSVVFDRITIDLADKPDWFRAILPLGKVPLLKIDRPGQNKAVLFESAAICEFIEETQSGPPLHPSDPITRAQHRAWIDIGSSILADIYAVQNAVVDDYPARLRTFLNAHDSIPRGIIRKSEMPIGRRHAAEQGSTR